MRREAIEVYHLAAVYDLGVARDLALRVNEEGTEHVLALAAEADALRRFQYVSTCYVSGRYAGVFRETDLDVGQSFNNHYEETKYLAEREVQEAMCGGLPATIYRPAIVVGDSRTGQTQKYDGPYYLIRWMLRWTHTVPMPVLGAPERHEVNVVPRDFVVKAIAHLSAIEASEGQVYYLADPAPPTVEEALRLLEEATGRRLLRARLPLGLAQAAMQRLPGLASWMQIKPEALAYFSHPTHYTTDHAQRDLAGSGICCPSFADYAHRLVAYVEAHPEVTSAAMR